MSVSIEDVRYIATLARLQFDEASEARLAGELSGILGYIEKLNELDTEGVEPMSHVLELRNVFREDVCTQRISHDEALRSAPDTDGDFFRVPKVID